MRRITIIFALVMSLVSSTSASAAPQEIGVIRDFGPNLTAACPQPEGIAIDPRGSIYASSFSNGAICVVDRTGVLVDTIAIGSPLIGMLFAPSQGLYVLDFGHATLLLVDVTTPHATRTIATGLGGPNALARDNHGNLYVSDSFGGRIWKIATDGATSVWKQDALLATAGFPPFGANGVAFDRNEANLYVANTGDDTIVRIPVNADGSAGAVSLFASGIDGPDGIAFDVRGNLYVCANQADEIAVISPVGTPIATYRGSGSSALHFPASLVFHGRDLFVTNLAFDHSFNPLPDSKISVLTVPLPGAPLRP
jgi:sugar lactone lactonase YvrE